MTAPTRAEVRAAAATDNLADLAEGASARAANVRDLVGRLTLSGRAQRAETPALMWSACR